MHSMKNSVDGWACSWCGITETQNRQDGFGPLTDITVTTARGEEGYAEEVRYACNEHLIKQTQLLVALGYGSHRHGGINFLETDLCPGYLNMSDCPTPEERL